MTDPSQTPRTDEAEDFHEANTEWRKGYKWPDARAWVPSEVSRELEAEVERLRAGIREHREAIEREYQTTKDTAAHNKLYALLDGAGEDS